MDPDPISAPVPAVVGTVITGTKYPPSGIETGDGNQKSNCLMSFTNEFAYMAIDFAASRELPPKNHKTHYIYIYGKEIPSGIMVAIHEKWYCCYITYRQWQSQNRNYVF